MKPITKGKCSLHKTDPLSNRWMSASLFRVFYGPPIESERWK